jgi:hypothetical protein
MLDGKSNPYVLMAKSQFLMVKSLCFDGQVPILDGSKANFHGAKPIFQSDHKIPILW